MIHNQERPTLEMREASQCQATVQFKQWKIFSCRLAMISTIPYRFKLFYEDNILVLPWRKFLHSEME